MVKAIALTIAGSDPSGGAGLQADLKTFAALGVYGMAVVTALTAQNTREVTGVHDVPPEFVGEQLDAVLTDIVPDAVKTGMLSNAAVIRVAAERVRRYEVAKLVVDPVMVAKSGDRLLAAEAVRALRDELLPLALVVTPNLPEAEELLGREVRTLEAMRKAARQVHEMGAANVVMKGGHLAGDTATDLLFDGKTYHEFASARVPTKNTHGTGCTFASAIAAYLALGEPVPEAVRRAKVYLSAAIEKAYDVGSGHGPVNHMWPLEGLSRKEA
jgi:hydroxymethylpyrimidine kinase/phosphomethylpyrimidine kinase